MTTQCQSYTHLIHKTRLQQLRFIEIQNGYIERQKDRIEYLKIYSEEMKKENQSTIEALRKKNDTLEFDRSMLHDKIESMDRKIKFEKEELYNHIKVLELTKKTLESRNFELYNENKFLRDSEETFEVMNRDLRSRIHLSDRESESLKN